MIKSIKHITSILTFLLVPYLGNSQLASTTDSVKSKLRSIDSVTLAEMKKYHIPGAVITIVLDNQIIQSKGYGLADLENRKFVDAYSTGFRIASLTKTFTATAALQLVSEGKLSLNKDIAAYLPDKNFEFLKGHPFTLHHLLTHTAGFDYTDIGDAARETEDIISIEKIVRNHMPKQVHKPGTVYSYSNYGYTLIGYIIQQVTGMSFSDYIRINILNKLEMTNTSLQQPLPKELRQNLAKSYKWSNGQIQLSRDYTNTLPAGGIISTGNDMGKYLIMQLNRGQKDSISILDPEYHKMLLTQQYGAKYSPYGICYSFFEEEWLGWRTLSHTGGQLGFLSQLLLVPEANIGIFISHNSRENTEPFRGVVAEFILKLLIGNNQKENTSIAIKSNEQTRLDKYEGVYKQVNHPVSTFEKTALLMGRYDSEVEVNMTSDGLLINNSEFVEIDRDVFKIKDSIRNSTVEFFKNDNGKPNRLLYGKETFMRIPFYLRSDFIRIVFSISLLILLLHFLFKTVEYLLKLLRQKKNILNFSKPLGLLNGWLYGTTSLYIISIFILVAHVSYYQDDLSDYGVPWGLKLAFALNIIAGLLTMVFPVATFSLWNSKELSTASKVFKSIITLSLIIVGIMLWEHNLIGFNY